MAPADSAIPTPAPMPGPGPALGPAPDGTVQAAPDDLPVPPDGVPHLSSPENLPPGTTDTPPDGGQPRTLGYLRDLWHAVQTQEVSGRDALLLLTQRPMNASTPVLTAGSAPPSRGATARLPRPDPRRRPEPAPAPAPPADALAQARSRSLA